jgi:drug/metabolite transporter (DMT)-like permease
MGSRMPGFLARSEAVSTRPRGAPPHAAGAAIVGSGSSYGKGALPGLAAATIWASWSAVTRLAVTTRLDPWDIAALRFGVAGLVLAPVVLRRGLALDHLGWLGLAAIIVGGGAPYGLFAAAGLGYAPASDQAALNPGCMPLFVALIAAVVLGEHVSAVRKLGLALIFAGGLLIVARHAVSLACSSHSLGHALSLFAAFLWACFTIIMRRARLDPLHAAALVASGSLVTYLPIYLAWHGTRLLEAPLADLAVQALFQGILVTIVSLLLYGRALAILGASAGAAFGALVPVLSALFAIPLLGEWPSAADWAGIAAIATGVYLASGGGTWRSTHAVARTGSD